MTATALILGASGRFGRHAADAFEAASWQVRRFRRGTDDLTDAAQGADVIVNAWNPPYTHWASELPGQTDRVIEAACASGAAILMVGNVYVYGADAPERFGPDTPHGAQNPLGRLRVELEARYRDADPQVILLRGGDFLDTQASGNWFDRMIAAKAREGRISYPGAMDVPHAWAYLPDMARAAVMLAERRATLANFEEVLFPGYTLSGNDLGAAIGRVLGRNVRVRPLSWLPIQIARPFWGMAKHLLEMRYLWTKPHFIDGDRFKVLLPDFQPTPLEEALATSIPD